MISKKIGAIALMLIVAVPILLGYAMAFDETEHNGWDSGEKTNITELVENTQVHYDVSNRTSVNNGNLIYDYLMPTPGGDIQVEEIQPVGWLTVGTKPTSVAAYSYSSQTETVSETTYTISSASGTITEADWPAGFNLSNIYICGSNGETLTFYPSVGQFWTDTAFNGLASTVDLTAQLDSQSTTSHRYIEHQNNSTHALDLDQFTIVGPANMTYKIYVRELTPFNALVLYPDLIGEMAFQLGTNSALIFRAYDENGNVDPQVYIFDGYNNPYLIREIAMDDGTLSIQMSNIYIPNVAQVMLALEPVYGGQMINIRDYDPPTYADVADGWHLSSYYQNQGYTGIEAIWSNDLQNSAVNMAMYMRPNTQVIMNPGGSASNDIDIRTDATSMTYVNDTALGNSAM